MSLIIADCLAGEAPGNDASNGQNLPEKVVEIDLNVYGFCPALTVYRRTPAAGGEKGKTCLPRPHIFRLLKTSLPPRSWTSTETGVFSDRKISSVPLRSRIGLWAIERELLADRIALERASEKLPAESVIVDNFAFSSLTIAPDKPARAPFITVPLMLNA